ncbi:MAG: iron-containing redox enzyme family protein [Proteobacteria bacterium]|nr:iron-containing redox enzyme family protein [Pseudomonadota bacterium]
MTQEFRRTGDLKSIGSYPVWLQRVVRETNVYKKRVVDHELFALMRDARLPLAAMQRFLVGVWPTIEQFPRFMSMNLKKVGYGESAGADMARRYLIHNIRVEQKHADHWVEWAKSAQLGLGDLRAAGELEGLQALAHWCWYVCDQASLPVAIAATNYAIEGATGEWSCLVCSENTYAESLPEEIRGPATRWLRLHAEYDDTHPWEALDVVATLLGHAPSPQQVAEVRQAIRSSFVYMEMALDHAMMGALHGTFDETASNASTLGTATLDAA